MMKLINTFFTMTGAMAISFGVMAAFTMMDYLEILVISGVVGMAAGLVNVLSVQEDEVR